MKIIPQGHPRLAMAPTLITTNTDINVQQITGYSAAYPPYRPERIIGRMMETPPSPMPTQPLQALSSAQSP
jgi:hypothetical protein